MPFPFKKKETGESMKKYVVIYQNDSSDPIVYGLFYSEKKRIHFLILSARASSSAVLL